MRRLLAVSAILGFTVISVWSVRPLLSSSPLSSVTARPSTLPALLVTAAAAAVSAPLECPLPGGADSADAATCQRYSACLWEEERCRLSDQVGYQLLQPPHVIHTGYELLLGRRSQAATMFGDDVERLTVTAVQYDDNRMALTVRRGSVLSHRMSGWDSFQTYQPFRPVEEQKR